MSTSYVSLHVHSHYSILNAVAKLPDLVAAAKANDMPAIALTDLGVMYGAVDFYRKAKAEGVQPILGCELYVIEGDPTDRVNKKRMNHLVLLAQNFTGYQNLVKLVSKAHLEGFYYKARVNWEQIEAHAEGLICLTAGLNGPIGYALMRNMTEDAEQRVAWLKRVFPGRLYLEIQDQGIEGQRAVNQAIVTMAQAMDLPLVACNESYYTTQPEAQAHDILLCMRDGKLLHDPSRMRFSSQEFYVKTGEQVRSALSYLDPHAVDQAIANTLVIAEHCSALELPLDQSLLPDFPVPEGETAASYLEKIVFEAATTRYAEVNDKVRDRLQLELSVINQMGFPAYFLIVWDFINYARQNNIPVGPGRGSAAGSAVAYCLGITNLDPIEHNLLFERFLNPERISMPDIDIDFCIDRRGQVIDYVTERYGTERVAQIITYGTLAARAALKAVCRVMDIPFSESDRLAKMIPATPGTKLKDALADGMELGKLYNSDPQVKNLVDLALQLEGSNANTGVHAAGVVIAKDPLTDIVPVQNSKEGQVTTQYSMDDVANLGLLKMDFLGLRNLTIIDKSLTLIEKYKHETPDLDHPDLNDPPIYEMLTSGQTDGVFQLESGGMKALVRELKPSTFEDINALVALFRPGPLNSGMVEEFVKRKHGKTKVTYAHPILEPILKDTYGTIVYQEQIMQIAQHLAGYTLGQADLLRRAMGKKKESEMLKQREAFLAGTQANGVAEAVAVELFDAMTEFAKYCFNRSHSAAYAFVAFQTAYLKVHYPVEYFSALLSSVSNDLDKIQLYILTAKKLGVPVLPPDINTSDADFTPDGTAIRFGLASIKNVGEGIVNRLIEIRSEQPFTSLEDFCTRAELKTINRRTMESLVLAGALDSLGISRKQLFENLDTMYSYTARIQERKETGQVSIFAALGATLQESSETPHGESLQLGGTPDEYPPEVLQQHEKTLLGTYVSSHPLDRLLDVLPLAASTSVKDLSELSDGATVVVAGLVSTIVNKTTRKNTPMRIGQLEDLTGQVEFVAFSEPIGLYDALLQDGQKVVMTAKLQFRNEDQPSLIVNHVRALDDVQILSLQFKQPPRFEDVAFLRELFKQHKGEDPVVLAWADNSQMVVGQQFWVNYNAAREAITPAISQRFANILTLAG